MINNITTLYIKFFHILFNFTFLLLVTFSNNINLLICVLLLILFIKYAFYKIGYCIITSLEKNDTINTTATTIGKIFLNSISDRKVEELTHNILILFIVNKLFILMSCKYYKIDIDKFFKNYIEKIF
jgi:hypothetical protein